MAVDLDTDPGGLFRRLGKLEDWRQKVVTNQAEVTTEIGDILDQYNDNRDYPVGIQEGEDLFIVQIGAPLSILREVARRTVLEMVHADDPLPAGELSPEGALKRLVEQMIASADSVDGTTITIGAVTAGGSNIGDGTFIVDDTDLDGVEIESMRSETLILRCISDGQPSGGATAGQEVFQIMGETAIGDTFSPDWSGGSGANFSSRITSASIRGSSAPGRNMLTNSDWESWS